MTNIIEAVKNNNVRLVHKYLHAQPGAIKTWDGDKNLLSLAVERGYVGMTQTLVWNGANIDLYYGPCHALSIAAQNNDFQMMEILLGLGADINKGYTLEAAANNGNVEMLHFLLKKGLDISLQGYAALQIATEKQDITFVKALLKNGAPVIAETREQSPLILAIQKNNLELVKLFANEETSNDHYLGMPAIIWAAKNNHDAIVSILLQSGANINATDSNGLTALSWSCSREHKESTTILISKGADYIDYLTSCIITNNLKALSTLINAGANVNSIEKSGHSILSHAAYLGYRDIVEYLIEQDASVNLPSPENNTALHWAAKAGHLNIAKLLINNGATVNVYNLNGESPLVVASLNGHYEIIKFLIEKKADYIEDTLLFSSDLPEELETFLQILEAAIDLNNIDHLGKTLLTEAAKAGDENLIRLLITAKVNLNIQDKDGDTALIISVIENNTDIINMLVSAGANLDIQNDEGYTALLVATGDIAQYLIQSGASVLTQNNHGMNAWTYARANEESAVLTLLNQKQTQLNNVSNFLFSHIAHNDTITQAHHPILKKFKEINKKDLSINYTNIYSKAQDFVSAKTLIIKGYKAIQEHFFAIKGVCKSNILSTKLTPDVTTLIASFLVSKQISDNKLVSFKTTSEKANIINQEEISFDDIEEIVTIAENITEVGSTLFLPNSVATVNNYFNDTEEYTARLYTEETEDHSSPLKRQRSTEYSEPEVFEQDLAGAVNDMDTING